MSNYYVPRKEWEGETCFILGGGPSATQHDLKKLRGHKLIVINSSCYVAPWGDFLVFSDTRWWDDNGKKAVAKFSGRIVSVSSLSRHVRLLRMKRKQTKGLSTDPSYLAISKTSLVSSINLAVHLGVKKIVLIGADGKNGGPDGKQTHHHVDHPHQWKQKPKCFDQQRTDIEPAAKDLKKLGIECVNASPGSRWEYLWPVVDFDEMIVQDSNRLAAPQPQQLVA